MGEPRDAGPPADFGGGSGPHSAIYMPPLKPVVGPDRVGRYQLLGVIGTGGMAEVFLAKQDGPAGFKKSVVIKRILPNLASDPKFVEMFQREARVAAGLNHTNIVQVFELGEDGGQPFIVMEYVVGVTLLRLQRSLRAAGRPMPVELALAAVSDAALGLHFAHTLVGDDGAPLGLVHRDISPDNLIVNREAVTKILDFGIAKGMKGSEATSSGDTKGKIPYMPPEQIRGDPLDGRADLYALGVTLFWLLTGTRPFKGKSEFELMQQVMSARPPKPSSIHPGIPRRVEELILALLEKDPKKRPASGDDVHAALVSFVPPRREIAPVVLDALFGRLPEVTVRSPRSDAPAPAVAPGDAAGADPADATVDGEEEPPSLAAPITVTGSDLWSVVSSAARTALTPAHAARPPGSRRTIGWAAVAVGAGAVAVALVIALANVDDGPAAPAPPVEVESASAAVAPPPPPPEPPPATTTAREDEPSVLPLEPSAAPDAAPAPRAGRPAPAPSPRTGTLVVEVAAPPEVVWVAGGKIVGRGGGSLALPAGTKKVIARDTSRNIEVDVAIAPGSRVDWARLPRGTLDVRVFPTAEVFAGKTRLGEAPLKLEVVAGRHKLRLKNGKLERTENVVVAAGKTAQVRARLE